MWRYIHKRFVRFISLPIGSVILFYSSLVPSHSVAQSNRVEFEDRLIKGQTAKKGSVMLFDRRLHPNHSLVSRQRRFRKRILDTVFDGGMEFERVKGHR